MIDLGKPLRFPKNDLGIPPRSFRYSGQPDPLLGFAPSLYRKGMLAVGHDFQPGAHASIVPGGAFQAGKFTGEEPTPGGPTQQGAAAQGAGPGAGEGETPGGGIETSARCEGGPAGRGQRPHAPTARELSICREDWRAGA